MAIKKFQLIEPAVEGLSYLAIVETDGDYEPMDDFAFTSDRQMYTLKYREVTGANPQSHVWDMGITFTGLKQRDIDYEVVDEKGTDLLRHEERPPVRDGL